MHEFSCNEIYKKNSFRKHYMPDIGAIVNSCREKKDVNGSFSAYIVKEYPYIFEESAEDIQQNKEFLLSTYESWDDDQLWSYRNSNLKKLLYKVCRQINYNYVVNIFVEIIF